MYQTDLMCFQYLNIQICAFSTYLLTKQKLLKGIVGSHTEFSCQCKEKPTCMFSFQNESMSNTSIGINNYLRGPPPYISHPIFL